MRADRFASDDWPRTSPPRRYQVVIKRIITPWRGTPETSAGGRTVTRMDLGRGWDLTDTQARQLRVPDRGEQ